ncbi:hypothetical protein [Planktotalea frisia]|jgi:hypothetical protein|nr:hypothetical protein [Planktotalea frisia]
MTNTLAIILGLLVTIAIVADVVMTDSTNIIFLAKKFTDMTEWLAFWR